MPPCLELVTLQHTSFVVSFLIFLFISSKAHLLLYILLKISVKQLNEDKDSISLRHFKVALSHAAQLSQVLAFYFGIRLPKKVASRDFACNDLDTKRFASRISRLHANILFLCSSQGVSPAHLRHINPLARLLTLLDPNVCDLGR